FPPPANYDEDNSEFEPGSASESEELEEDIDATESSVVTGATSSSKRRRPSSAPASIGSRKSKRIKKNESSTVPQTSPIVKKKPDPLWALFTDKPNAWRRDETDWANCKHCGEQFRHHRKLLSVKTHLRHCFPFQQMMKKLPDHKQPDWYCAKQLRTSLGATIDATSAALPKLTKEEQDEVAYHMAMFCYATGASFKAMENANLKLAVDVCRPGASVPSRKRLSTTLLDHCYTVMKEKVEKALEETSSFVCITSDGWSNVNNDSIINYMAVASPKTFFIDCVNMEEKAHTSSFIANDIIRVAKTLKGKVAGVVMDNTAANKKAGQLLLQAHPNWLVHGCVAHALNLLVRDIFSPPKKALAGQDKAVPPVVYPFVSLHEHAQVCKEIVIFFKTSQAHKAALEKQQKAISTPKLVLPAVTRWGTLQGCFVSLLQSATILQNYVKSPDFVSGTKLQKEKKEQVKNFILEDDFVDMLQHSIEMIKPIDELLVKFQSDLVPVSEVYENFINLTVPYNEMSTLNQKMKDYVYNAVTNRYALMEGKSHRLAYLLDPRYLGEHMSAQELEQAEEELFTFPDYSGKSDKARQDELLKQYTAFRVQALAAKSNESRRYTALKEKTRTVLQHWLCEGVSWLLLQDIAIRVFSMAASSAASERNFSMASYVHSKQRNRLTHDKVKKLLYVKTNAAQLGED
ncbi:MAG TPA: DUF domain-containing protein, partial [Phormidium sp.]